MRCDQFEDRLNDVLDSRDDPRGDAALVAHAAGCRDCRKLAAAYAVLTDGATELRRTAEPMAMELSPARRPAWTLVAAPLMAVAATALFMFYQAPAVDHDAALQATVVPNTPAAAVVMSPTADPPIADEPASAAMLELEPPVVIDLAHSTGRTYAGWVHGTARSLDDALALAVALPPAQQLLEPVLFPEDGLLRRMEDRLAPVADETLEALRQVFQSQDSQQL